MEPFKSITSRYVTLPLDDIDTDLIIPAEYLKSISRDGYAEALFRRLRDTDPAFPLNNSALRDARILVAGKNFGCGSSREHAVWALREWGFRVVIAESFADIFSGNSAKNGLLLVCLKADAIAAFRHAPGGCAVTVDLEAQTVKSREGCYSFSIDPFRKYCLLEGIDELRYLVSRKNVIEAYFNR